MDFIVEFFNVEGEAEKQEFNIDFEQAAKEKSAEGHILFQNAKGTLNLNGAVEPENDTVDSFDSGFGVGTLANEGLRDM